jgi:hypothetical protein
MDGQILALLITSVVGVLTGALGAWKSAHDSRLALATAAQLHEQTRQDRLDAAALARAERLDEAAGIAAALATEQARTRAEIDTHAHRLDITTRATAAQLQERQQVDLQAQTADLRQTIEDAKHFTAEKAGLALTAANDFNTKIHKLQQTVAAQQAHIDKLVNALQPATITVVTPRAEERP